jgi:poly-gamma-glutamate capsule biosynthesis protein CapA/YwtB (metallophosphatase superfamily)
MVNNLYISRFAGFDIMSLANNHLNDYGEKPVNFTRNILSNAGIESFGSNFGSYDSPQVCSIHQLCCTVVNGNNYTTISQGRVEQPARCRKRVNILNERD